MMKRIAIITSHPVQYNAPLFRRLSSIDDVIVKVYYTAGKDHFGDDVGFARQIEWDIPLLDGYDYEFLMNDAKRPGLGKFRGIRNPEILDHVDHFKPDVILVYGWSYSSHLKAMRYYSGKIPVWFRGDSTLLDERPGLKQTFRRKFLKWVYQYVDKVLYVGEANKAYFKAHGILDGQLIFVPHAVDNEHFYDSPEKQYEKKAQKWRKELGIPEQATVFLFAGKFIPKKDPLLLINAFKQIHLSTYPHIHLILVGNGPLETRMKKAASGHPNIHFLPFQNQSQMPVVYRLGDIFVLPSTGPGETWGLAINEAMACSMPVIASTRSGCRTDLVRDGYNGYGFSSGDRQDLQHVMEKMVKVDLDSMGKRSGEIITRWSYEVMLDRIQKIL
jgi:glycosyltransferase involved in cell wall biosynthesis